MAKHYWSGIKGYEPQFQDNVDDFKKKHGSFLRSLPGQDILEVWCLWSLEFKEFCYDAPIIVVTDKQQIELTVEKCYDFSMTFNTINLAEPVRWYCEDGFEFRKFCAFTNFSIQSVKLIELLHGIAKKPDFWAWGGLAFFGKHNFFSVENGLDINVIRTEISDGDFFKFSEI